MSWQITIINAISISANDKSNRVYDNRTGTVSHDGLNSISVPEPKAIANAKKQLLNFPVHRYFPL